MTWQLLTITGVAKRLITPLEISMELSGLHCLSYSSANQDEIFEPAPGTTPLWPVVTVQAIFPPDIDLQALINSLQQDFHFTSQQIDLKPFHDEDWQKNFEQSMQPLRFGDNLWIIPSHHTPPDPKATNIHLDPGLAFGTGSHPTTRSCLEVIAKTDLKHSHVVDYGCGSGILAIACAKKGARVWATDIDPQAIEATQRNAQNNHVLEQIELCSDQDLPVENFDFVFANILASTLLEYRDRFRQLLKIGGQLILSGILLEQRDSITSHYQSSFSLLECHSDQEWLRIIFSKR